MPIDIGTFERESSFEDAETHSERIVRFLAANDDQAFEREEIARGTGIGPNTVSSVLSRLKKRNLVRHKPPYWALTDDEERLRRMSDHHRITQLFDERYGAEDRAEPLAWSDDGAE